jgi:Patatin-like phospholipase
MHMTAEEVCTKEIPILRERRKANFPNGPEIDDQQLRGELFGLCLSGGGIRSATFNLGILQGLATKRLLKFVDYLSTVSGGGYIGGWLHGIVRRRPSDYEMYLETEDSNPGPATEDPITFLRKYTNYLAPQLGILSPDAWVIGAIWFRNTLLNQIVLYSG